MFLRFARFLMEVADGGGASGGGTPAPTEKPAEKPATPVAPAPGEEFKGMTKEQFNERLERQTEAGKKSILKEFGFKDADEAKTFFEAARKEAEAKKTEEQRTKEKIAALEPAAAKASALEKTIDTYLQIEESQIPEDKKGLLELAPSAEVDKAARLEWIAKAKKQGLFAAAAPAAATTTEAQKQPANTRAGSTPPPAPSVPGQKHARDMTPDEFRRFEQERLAAHTARR